MFMRFVQMKVKTGQYMELRRHYDEIVLPELMKIGGCQYACLIQADRHEEEWVSMTLWDTLAHAEAYDRSEVFRRLMGVLQPYMADSSEWRIRLSSDMTLEYSQPPEDPVVKSYSISAAAGGKLVPQESNPSMYVRLVSAKIQPDRVEEFRDLYLHEIIPALRTVPGCRYAYLTQNINEKHEYISVTIWDSKEMAEHYEQSGVYEKLLKQVRHTFSGLYQWKMALEKEPGGLAVTSEDLAVTAYNVVTGKTFQ